MHGKIIKNLRLYSHGMGIKSISATLGLSRNRVRRYIRAYQELGKSINELLRLDEEHLQELLFCGRDIEFTPSRNELELRPLLPAYAGRLRRNRKLSKKVLYTEYTEKSQTRSVERNTEKHLTLSAILRKQVWRVGRESRRMETTQNKMK